MIPAFLIHSSDSHDRDDVVKNILDEVNVEIVEAIVLDNRLLGCCLSHLKVAHLARQLYPNLPYLVLEDDCVLKPGWKEGVWDLSGDVVYLGYNDKHSTGVLFGTHAMLISPAARDYLIEHLEQSIRSSKVPEYDWLCWKLWMDGKFEVGSPDQKDLYCEQKKGLVSLITGNIR
jgi:hypothetical protein